MTANDAPLEKIRGLLAMAERGATEAEREAFNAKAAELLAKYGLDRAMLAADDPQADVVGDRIVTVTAPYSLDKALLIGGIADELGCRVVYLSKGSRRSVHLFGHASDMERAEILYTSLLVQAAVALSALYVPWGEHPAAYKRSFLAGFTRAVRIRLRRAERAARARREANQPTGSVSSGPSVALVLVDRSKRVDQAVKKRYPKLGKLRRTLSGSGERDGIEAGARARLDTGGPRLGRTSATKEITV